MEPGRLQCAHPVSGRRGFETQRLTRHRMGQGQARGVQGEIILGDARRSLAKGGREGFYQMIFVDGPAPEEAAPAS